MVSLASDDMIAEHFVLKRIELANGGEFANRCQELIEAFVCFLGMRVEHIAFLDLILLRHEIFAELHKDNIGILSFLSCHGKISAYVQTFLLPINDKNVAAKIFLSLSASFVAVA